MIINIIVNMKQYDMTSHYLMRWFFLWSFLIAVIELYLPFYNILERGQVVDVEYDDTTVSPSIVGTRQTTISLLAFLQQKNETYEFHSY